MSGRHRVLVVEDEKATAEDLCEIVRALERRSSALVA